MNSLDELLASLRVVEVGPAPHEATIVARARRKRSRRTRRFASGAAAASLIIVACAVFAFHGSSSDPRVAVRDGAGGSKTTAPSSTLTQTSLADAAPSGMSDVLEAQYPDSFGGLVASGPHTLEVFAVGDPAAVRSAAQRYAGTSYRVVVHTAAHTLKVIRALELRIESEEASLAQEDIHIGGTGIRLESTGPRVLVLLSPDAAFAEAALRARYGDDSLTIVDSPRVATGRDVVFPKSETSVP